MRVAIFLTYFLFNTLFIYAANITDLEKATVSVAQEVGPAVVSISSIVKQRVVIQRGATPFEGYFNSQFGDSHDQFMQRFFEEFFGPRQFEREFQRQGLGSGVIIDKDGYILTNEHVIGGAASIKVKLSDGRDFDAQLKGADRRSDLAIIKIDAKNLPFAKLGDSSKLEIGRFVMAIGNPFGYAIENPEPTVTLGLISALHRYLPALGKRERSYDDFIQTDAAINPGNSGGPLVNLDGEVIGINTAIITTTGGYQGIGFAIPVNSAKKILDKLIKGEKVLYGWLGVNIQDLNDDLRSYFGTDKKEGVIITKVYKDSPAEKSGLREGDLILTFAEQPIKTSSDLVRLVYSCEVDSKIPVKLIREGKEQIISVLIGKQTEDVTGMQELEEEPGVLSEESEMLEFRGMQVEDINNRLQRQFALSVEQGVVIVEIKEDSLAEKSGLKVGDIIIKMENREIKNKKDFVNITSKIKGTCLIKTQRGYFVLKGKN